MMSEASAERIRVYKAENLDQVLRIYSFKALMSKVRPLLFMTPDQRDWTLRHHREGDVTSKTEMAYRQALDALLHSCGVINAGWWAGAIGSIDVPEITEARDFLLVEEVTAYFKFRYPLPYMSSFMKLLEHSKMEAPAFKPEWFGSLLRVDAIFRDPLLEDFLLIIDGYWLAQEKVNFEVLAGEVCRAEPVISALVTPAAERTVLQSAIFGLERFLLFCDDLQKVIDAAAESQDLQLAAFQLYQYWFSVRGNKLGTIMNAALDTLTSDKGVGDAFEAAERSVNQLLRRPQFE